MTRLALFRIAAVVIAIVAVAWGLSRFVRVETLFEHYGAITVYVRAHFAVALALFMLVYVAVVVFSVPVALALSLTGGALFGGAVAGLAVLFAATLGATIVFLAARGLLHDYFIRKSGPWLGRLRQDFQADAASYLLFLRLTPVFPFFMVNLAAGLLGARLGTYVWTTFLGIMPGTLAYCFVGAGLNGILEAEATRLAECRAGGAPDCRAVFDPTSLISRDIALGLAGMGLLVLISLLARRYRARSATAKVDSERK